MRTTKTTGRRSTVPECLAVIERDPEGDAWLVTFPELPGAHTYGRTLASARTRAAEAAAAWLDVDNVSVVTRVQLPPKLAEAVAQARAQREEAVRAAKAANATTSTVARRLAEARLGTRDAGELLGLSAQRVQQVLGREGSKRVPTEEGPFRIRARPAVSRKSSAGALRAAAARKSSGGAVKTAGSRKSSGGVVKATKAAPSGRASRAPATSAARSASRR